MNERKLGLIILSIVGIIGILALVFLFANAKITGKVTSEYKKYLLFEEYGSGSKRTHTFHVSEYDLPVTLLLQQLTPLEDSSYAITFVKVIDRETGEGVADLYLRGVKDCDSKNMCESHSETWIYTAGEFYIEIDSTVDSWYMNVMSFGRWSEDRRKAEGEKI